jgi:hypothetical protein
VRYNALNTDPTSKGQKGYTHAMKRIPPSQRIRKRTEELLNQGLEGEGDVTSLIFGWLKSCSNRKRPTIWTENTINGAGQSRNTAAIAMATSQGGSAQPKGRSSSRCRRCVMRPRPIVRS